jgi:hypothetical protein
MSKKLDWRSETAALNQLERQGFAWEFLRRNSSYRADYERIADRATAKTPEVANAGTGG